MKVLLKSDEIIAYRVKSVLIHPDYYSLRLNDIALIRLYEDLSFNAFVQPIALPKQNQIFDNVAKYFVAGWGAKIDLSDETFLTKKLNFATKMRPENKTNQLQWKRDMIKKSRKPHNYENYLKRVLKLTTKMKSEKRIDYLNWMKELRIKVLFS